MRSAVCIVTLVLALVLSSCATVPSEESELRALVARFIDAVNAADTDKFMDFFAEDATAFLPSSGERRRGRDAIRAAVAPAFAQGPRAVRAEANDLTLAIDRATAIASFDAGSGTQHARRTLILKQTALGWKITHLHASNVSQ